MSELLKLLPQQWIGICALILFGFYVFGQVVEKYEAVAKIVPLGKWWHDRSKRKVEDDAEALSRAIEAARQTWSRHENAALATLESRVAVIAAVSKQQSTNIEELQESIRCFTAFSVYDARWHHRVDIDIADRSQCVLPPHLDYFSFERIWLEDPVAASRLPL